MDYIKVVVQIVNCLINLIGLVLRFIENNKNNKNRS
jgi:hypothetical protein